MKIISLLNRSSGEVEAATEVAVEDTEEAAVEEGAVDITAVAVVEDIAEAAEAEDEIGGAAVAEGEGEGITEAVAAAECRMPAGLEAEVEEAVAGDAINVKVLFWIQDEDMLHSHSQVIRAMMSKHLGFS